MSITTSPGITDFDNKAFEAAKAQAGEVRKAAAKTSKPKKKSISLMEMAGHAEAEAAMHIEAIAKLEKDIERLRRAAKAAWKTAAECHEKAATQLRERL